MRGYQLSGGVPKIILFLPAIPSLNLLKLNFSYTGSEHSLEQSRSQKPITLEDPGEIIGLKEDKTAFERDRRRRLFPFRKQASHF